MTPVCRSKAVSDSNIFSDVQERAIGEMVVVVVWRRPAEDALSERVGKEVSNIAAGIPNFSAPLFGHSNKFAFVQSSKTAFFQ